MPTIPKNRKPRDILVRGVPADVYEVLKALAEADRRSLNGYLLVLLEKHVQNESKKEPQ